MTDETDPFGADTPWTGDARRLLTRAIARHGGWAAWHATNGIALRVATLAGRLPESKGVGVTFPAPTRVEVWPRRDLVVLQDYPVVGQRGVYSAGQVHILEGEAILEARADPRASFKGRRARRSWSALDALYVFGASLASAQALPFSLTSARPLSFRGARSQGLPLWGVEIDVPGTTLNHRLEQTIFFDKEGFVRRHDYAFGVVGWWASVADLFDDYVEVGGLAVARRRRIVGRLGRFELGSVAIDLTFDDVAAIPAVEPTRPRLSLV
ncbi:MAG TPA: hypothetical protein VH560_10040 [Polyangia bacterium]|nr:hypothetical protein [Polyangia bacterium]